MVPYAYSSSARQIATPPIILSLGSPVLGILSLVNIFSLFPEAYTGTN